MDDKPQISVTTDQSTVTVQIPEPPRSDNVSSDGQFVHTKDGGETKENVDNPVEKEAQPIVGEIVEKEKKVMGRPSKYNDEILAKAKAYYHKCLGNVDNKKRMPLLEELARILDVHGETMTEWEDEYPDFSETLKKIRQLQKERIIQTGFGAKNPTFSIFMLKANHGMMETEKRVLAGERGADPIQLNTVNYKDSTAKLPEASPIQQAVIEEGTE